MNDAFIIVLLLYCTLMKSRFDSKFHSMFFSFVILNWNRNLKFVSSITAQFAGYEMATCALKWLIMLSTYLKKKSAISQWNDLVE